MGRGRVANRVYASFLPIWGFGHALKRSMSRWETRERAPCAAPRTPRDRWCLSIQLLRVNARDDDSRCMVLRLDHVTCRSSLYGRTAPSHPCAASASAEPGFHGNPRHRHADAKYSDLRARSATDGSATFLEERTCERYDGGRPNTHRMRFLGRQDRGPAYWPPNSSVSSSRPMPTVAGTRLVKNNKRFGCSLAGTNCSQKFE